MQEKKLPWIFLFLPIRKLMYLSIARRSMYRLTILLINCRDTGLKYIAGCGANCYSVSSVKTWPTKLPQSWLSDRALTISLEPILPNHPKSNSKRNHARPEPVTSWLWPPTTRHLAAFPSPGVCMIFKLSMKNGYNPKFTADGWAPAFYFSTYVTWTSTCMASFWRNY